MNEEMLEYLYPDLYTNESEKENFVLSSLSDNTHLQSDTDFVGTMYE